MMLTAARTRSGRACIALVAFALGSVQAQSATRRPSHVAQTRHDIVQCLPAKPPATADRSDLAMAPAAAGARLFAPTRSAVFFAHSGDRCDWHPGGAAKG